LKWIVLVSIVLILLCVSLNARKKISEMNEVITLTKEDSLCLERGHITLDTDVYIVTRENVLPFVVDYPDSNVVYFYEDNIQKGVIEKCARCKKWISMPRMEAPLQYVSWRKTTKKDSLEEK